MDFYQEQSDNEVILTASKTGRDAPSDEGQLTVDVFQTGSEIVVKSTIAGVTANDIDIFLTTEMVTIKGNRMPDENIKNSEYYHQELYWGSFSRTIILPEEIDVDGAKASMKNGLLTIRLPKLTRIKTKKLKVSY